MKTSTETDCPLIDHKSVVFCGIIVAAGTANRFGGSIPKQFLPLGALPVVVHSIAAMISHPQCTSCIVVVSESERDRADKLIRDNMKETDKLCLVTGSDTRAGSVSNGVQAALEANPDVVLIHDAARPGLSHDTLNNLLEALATHEGAAPALPVVDALKKQTGAGIESVDRSDLHRIQTPQAFRIGVAADLYQSIDQTAVDDFELAQKAGLSLKLVQGSEVLSKITYPEDEERVLRLMTAKTEIRFGQGYDVHAFEPGEFVTLCGTHIPHDKKLKGHSDADVAWHALTDAILGALALGDIGDHFPPSDPQWKGAPSDVFLKFAGDKVAENGGRILNVDLTIICEAPKIKPNREAMRESTAKVLGIDLARVSVKATTTEGLGFEGRREGISSMASVSVELSDPRH